MAVKLDNNRFLLGPVDPLSNNARIAWIDGGRLSKLYRGQVNEQKEPHGVGTFYGSDRVTILEEGWYQNGVLEKIERISAQLRSSSSPCIPITKIPPLSIRKSLETPFEESVLFGGDFRFFGEGAKGFGKSLLPQGNLYIGYLENNLPRGLGIYSCMEGIAFLGRFNGGYVCENGKILYADGAVYTGPFQDMKPHGFGRLIDKKGTYVGKWEKGLRHGPGEQKWSGGVSYVGEWKNNVPSYGKYCPDGNRTIFGKFNRCAGEGNGKILYGDRTVYTGSFQNTKPHGFGSCVCKGMTYIGGWKKGLRHGHGEQKWSDGATYVGEWKNDVPSYGKYCPDKNRTILGQFNGLTGKGSGKILYYAEGAVYTGSFQNTKPHGFGSYIEEKGTYVGEWEKGLRHGHGEMKWSDGATYVGEWKNNHACGYGKQTTSNGTIFEGTFENNKSIGSFTVTFPNGTKTTHLFSS